MIPGFLEIVLSGEPVRWRRPDQAESKMRALAIYQEGTCSSSLVFLEFHNSWNKEALDCLYVLRWPGMDEGRRGTPVGARSHDPLHGRSTAGRRGDCGREEATGRGRGERREPRRVALIPERVCSGQHLATIVAGVEAKMIRHTCQRGCCVHPGTEAMGGARYGGSVVAYAFREESM